MTTLEARPSAPVFSPLSSTPAFTGSVGSTTAIRRIPATKRSLLLPRGRLVHASSPVVELLPQLEVQERLGRDHVGQSPDLVRHVEQRAPVGTDELDEHIELTGGDDDVI